MSVYTSFVSAALAEGSTTAVLRDVKDRYLLEDEVELHEFVVGHVRRHGTLPSTATLQREGHRLTQHQEPPTYYLDQLRRRFVYNTINERHEALRDFMANRDAVNAVAWLRDVLAEVGNTADESAITTLAARVDDVIEEYDSRKLRGGLAGVTLGWETADRLTLGAMGGDLIVYAGRPSMGKSWLLFESAYQAWLAGHSVAMISMEMSLQQVVRRWMGRHLGINPNFIRAGQLSQWTEDMLRGYGDLIAEMPNVFLLSGNMERSVSSVESIFMEHLPDKMYIDAAYLMTPEGQKYGHLKKWESMSMVMSQLKQIGVRYDRPTAMTVQFNRNVKNSSTRELDMSDIGGSDSVPQDASIIFGIKKGLPPNETTRRQIEMMKNREGEIESFETSFQFTPPQMVEVDPEDDSGVSAESVGWMV